MNKKLLALAIAAALAPAAAMADGGNVKITGNMHVSLDSLNTGVDRETNISSNSSWIRFSGDESLGNGLKAIWQVESTIALDDGDSKVADRNSFLGLSGGFGTALMGKHDTPLKMIGRSVDLFGDQIGDSRNIIAQGVNDLRPNNVIAYVSPEFAGVTVIGAYVTNVTNDATMPNDTTAWSASAQWKSGPIMVGGAWQTIDTAIQDIDTYRLVAGMTFGDFRVTGLYQNADFGPTDIDAWGVGAAFKMGAFTFKGQYYGADDSVANLDANMYALGVDYALSKRTTTYVAYAVTDNDPNAKYSAFGAGHGDNPGVVMGDKGDGLSLGLIHKF